MICAVVAIDNKNGMGKNGSIPWKIKGEQRRFREITSPHPIIMGRKTFESIGKVLPDRLNIVITSKPGNNEAGLSFANSLDEAIKIAQEKDNEIYIIGGGQIFKEAMEKNLIGRLYLTIVDTDFDCDTFFPDYSNFTKVIAEEDNDNGEYKYKFLTLEK